jgi:hypothetical protein
MRKDPTDFNLPDLPDDAENWKDFEIPPKIVATTQFEFEGGDLDDSQAPLLTQQHSHPRKMKKKKKKKLMKNMDDDEEALANELEEFEKLKKA